MKFSREYTKLQDRLFTTIRNHSFYNVGQVIPCRSPMQDSWKARVLLKVPMKFKEIPEDLLRYDTDCPELSGLQIRDEIRAFYRRDAPNDDWEMTIYILEKLIDEPECKNPPGGNA